MSMEYEIRKHISDTHELIDRCDIRISESHGWIRLAVLLRSLRDYLDCAERACENGEHVEAVGWLKSGVDELGTLADEAQQAESELQQMDHGFVGTACWLWTEREFAVPYRDGWFDASAVMTELETTLPDYCEYTDEKPSAEWCKQVDGDVWIHESHLYPLVNSADVKFQMFMVQKIKHMLRESPAREHHQASLYAVCPEIHDALFPDAASGEAK